MNVKRHITVTSMLAKTFSRPGMAVSQEESLPFPLKRQPARAEGGEDVKDLRWITIQTTPRHYSF